MTIKAEQPITVLIVDDNEMLRSVLAEYLSFVHPTWRVLEAENGKAGLDVAKTVRPDIILLDFHMPVMNGYEMVLALQAMPMICSIPLVLTTCEDSSDPRVAALQRICRKVLPKPFDYNDLEQTLQQHIGMRTSYRWQPLLCPA
jgi:CheY-like chemotaxis protein